MVLFCKIQLLSDNWKETTRAWGRNWRNLLLKWLPLFWQTKSCFARVQRHVDNCNRRPGDPSSDGPASSPILSDNINKWTRQFISIAQKKQSKKQQQKKLDYSFPGMSFHFLFYMIYFTFPVSVKWNILILSRFISIIYVNYNILLLRHLTSRDHLTIFFV